MQAAVQKIKRVLLIDDDPEEFFIFDLAIQQIDSSIKICQLKKSAENISKPEIDFYDLIFLDVNMPVTDGYGWLFKLKELGCVSPIVMYSTTMHQGRVNKAYQAGAHLFLPKPDNFVELVNSLTSIFEFNWGKPEDIREKHLKNGNYMPFCMQPVFAKEIA